MTSSGKNTIVVYETKKLKALKAKSKKKREAVEDDLPMSRRKAGDTARPGTSLPPVSERKHLKLMKQLMDEVLESEPCVLVHPEPQNFWAPCDDSVDAGIEEGWEIGSTPSAREESWAHGCSSDSLVVDDFSSANSEASTVEQVAAKMQQLGFLEQSHQELGIVGKKCY